MLRRAIRVLLRLLPADVRGDLGRDMEETLVEETREARGVVGRARVWIRNVVSFAALGLPLHLEQTWQDVRYGVRTLLATPVFTVIAVLAIALGVGSAASTFALSDAMLLKPLPFADPDRLVHVWSTDRVRGEREVRSTLPEVEAWTRQGAVVEGVAIFNYTSEELTGAGDPERVPSGRVSANVFDVLGVPPARGRAFLPGEDAPGASPVAIVSHGFWQRRLGGRDDVLDRQIEIAGVRHQIVGVMPPAFVFPLPITEIWVPRTIDRARYTAELGIFQVVARLRPNVTAGQAQAAFTAASAAIARDLPALEGHGANVTELRRALNFAYDIFAIGAVVIGAANVLVLLTACANISSLMLGRAIRRGREAALRAAIGASRGRLVRQYLVESLILATAGGALGAVIAAWGVGLADGMIPGDLYRVEAFRIDLRGLLVAFGLSSAAALVFGLVPAIRLARVNLAEAMRQDGGAGTTSRASLRWQSGLVVKQVALAVVLLVAMLLTIRSFGALRNVDPGFRADGVLTVQTILSRARYPSDSQIDHFVRGAVEKVRAIPGVRHAAFVNFLPLNHETNRQRYAPGGTTLSDAAAPTAEILSVTAEYFDALRISLLQGRSFADQDRTDTEPVVVINQTMAERHWPRGAVGESVLIDGLGPPARIVGVVADTRQSDLAVAGRAQAFVALSQRPGTYMRLVVSGDGDPRGLIPAVRAAVHGVDPALPLTEIRPLSDVVEEFLLPQLGLGGALLVPGGIALGLALFGIYGVVACFVSDRTREMGIRVAVGADRRQIVRYVLARGLRLAVWGVVFGVPIAAVLAYALRGLLFGVSAAAPAVYLAVAVLVGSVAALASYVPARRAARVNPLTVMKSG